jgi:hypothetical protein
MVEGNLCDAAIVGVMILNGHSLIVIVIKYELDVTVVVTDHDDVCCFVLALSHV